MTHSGRVEGKVYEIVLLVLMKRSVIDPTQTRQQWKSDLYVLSINFKVSII